MTLKESFAAGTDMAVSISGTTYYQTFTLTSDHTIAAIGLYLSKGGTSPGVVTVSLRDTEGKQDLAIGSRPGGRDLVDFVFDGSAIADVPTWYLFPFNKLLHQTSGDILSILVKEEGGAGTISWYGVAAGGYAGGNEGYWDDTAGLWIAETADLYFRVYSGYDEELNRRINSLYPVSPVKIQMRLLPP